MLQAGGTPHIFNVENTGMQLIVMPQQTANGERHD